MKKTLQIILLLFIVTTTTAQEIPGIKQQPQWAMPFYFEDAKGEMDTVWVGYDPSATLSIGHDPDFEKFTIKDTSNFQVMLFPDHPYPVGSWSDSVKMVEILSFENPGILIGFHNGKMPITMKWENNRFYSDSLPYPDIFPRPRARANLECFNAEPPYWYCYTPSPHPPLILTDYYSSEFQFTRVYRDSFYFDGSGNMPPSEAIAMNIIIVPHTQPVGIKETGKIYADVYPNPFTNAVYIAGITGRYEVTLRDVSGRMVKNLAIELQQEEIYTLDMADVRHGVYSLTIQNNRSLVTKKLIK